MKMFRDSQGTRFQGILIVRYFIRFQKYLRNFKILQDFKEFEGLYNLRNSKDFHGLSKDFKVLVF